LASDRRVDKYAVERAIENATLLMENKYSESERKPMIEKMKDMASTIEYDHNLDGIGMYISKNSGTMIQFPFPVMEKVTVGDNFEIRDLLYKIYLSQPYFALMLTEKKVRLFEGVMDKVTEIRGKHFPYDFIDDYEYNTPSRGSSNIGNPQMRSFEHDKSTLEAKRFKDFFREADEYLGDYMVQDIPLVISGTDKDISWFESITEFKKQIVGKYSGSHDNTNLSELGKKYWALVESDLKDKVDTLIKEYNEKVGLGLGVAGIQDIWSAAFEGKGLNLIVEKDYKVPGFVVSENEHFLTLRPPKEVHATIPDAVDEIIETILDKGGNVYFTDNGRLSEYGGMVLISRY
jgi:Bacterial archaeo-eukaryotic release factor family 3